MGEKRVKDDVKERERQLEIFEVHLLLLISIPPVISCKLINFSSCRASNFSPSSSKAHTVNNAGTVTVTVTSDTSRNNVAHSELDLSKVSEWRGIKVMDYCSRLLFGRSIREIKISLRSGRSVKCYEEKDRRIYS